MYKGRQKIPQLQQRVEKRIPSPLPISCTNRPVLCLCFQLGRYKQKGEGGAVESWEDVQHTLPITKFYTLPALQWRAAGLFTRIPVYVALQASTGTATKKTAGSLSTVRAVTSCTPGKCFPERSPLEWMVRLERSCSSDSSPKVVYDRSRKFHSLDYQNG